MLPSQFCQIIGQILLRYQARSDLAAALLCPPVLQFAPLTAFGFTDLISSGVRLVYSGAECIVKMGDVWFKD